MQHLTSVAQGTDANFHHILVIGTYDTQVPSEHIEDLKSERQFSTSTPTRSPLSGYGAQYHRNTPAIQLETAIGAAIKHFKGAHGVNVPVHFSCP